MTNEELKKKIVEILNDVTTEPMIYKGRYLGDTQMPELKINAIADALIAAGLTFGNKHRVLVEKAPIPTDYIGNECFLIPNTPPTIKQLHSGEEVEKMAKERDEYKHRAARAERALQIADELGELCGRKEDYVQQAEKELEEEREDD